jgi:hypothetical protein
VLPSRCGQTFSTGDDQAATRTTTKTKPPATMADSMMIRRTCKLLDKPLALQRRATKAYVRGLMSQRRTPLANATCRRRRHRATATLDSARRPRRYHLLLSLLLLLLAASKNKQIIAQKRRSSPLRRVSSSVRQAMPQVAAGIEPRHHCCATIVLHALHKLTNWKNERMSRLACVCMFVCSLWV